MLYVGGHGLDQALDSQYLMLVVRCDSTTSDEFLFKVTYCQMFDCPINFNHKYREACN